MKKVCEDCSHNRYCGGEYVDGKGCCYKHYYNKDEKYVMMDEKKEEKEMEFDQYIQNVESIGFEFMPDDSQVKIQVRAGEDIYLFLLEGEGAKILDDRYTELIAEKRRLKKENDELFNKHNVLVLEHDSLLEKYKEQEAKIADLQIEKVRLEHEKKDISEHDRKLDHDLRVKAAAYETLKADFHGLKKSLGAKSCEQCDRFEAVYEECTRLEKENHELALKMRNQSKEIDKLKKRNKELNQQIDEMVLDSYDGCRAILHHQEFTMDELVARVLELEKLKTPTIENFTDEEPSSRRDILRCAEKYVCGQREQDYGTPESNFQLIADLWNDYLKKERSSIVVDATDVAMMMALLKIARIRNGGGTGDSFVDLAGYAACGGEINAQKKATKTN